MNRNKKTRTVICRHCGKEFLTYSYLMGTAKFCSRDCWYAYNTKTKTVIRICKICGASFTTTPGVLRISKNKATYCSRKCRGTAQTQAALSVPQKGRGNRLADQKWKIAVREKDDNTCQRCGVVQKYIHTHHVATRSRRPDLKHDVSNGKCLCNSCHTWVHHHPIEAVALGLLSEATYELAATRKKWLRDIQAQDAAKRRKLAPEDLSYVILIDNNAHDIIEHLPPEEMKRIVDETIAAREIQP